MSNRQVILTRQADGRFSAGCFVKRDAAMPVPCEGEVLLRTRLLAIDPMVRILIDAAPLAGSLAALPEGSVIPGVATAEVIESRDPGLREGDLVTARTGWQSYSVVRGAGLHKIDVALAPEAQWLVTLGMPGFTAFAGLQLFGRMTTGSTILVSGASGAVGTLFAQFASAAGGARLVGITTAEKSAALREAGFSAVIARDDANFPGRIAAVLGAGAEGYFDNIGGTLFAQLLPHMARRGRIVIAGLMAQYDESGRGGPALGPALEWIFGRQLTVTAFAHGDHEAALMPVFLETAVQLQREGKLSYPIRIEEGLDAAVQASLDLFEPRVIGKTLVRLAG